MQNKQTNKLVSPLAPNRSNLSTQATFRESLTLSLICVLSLLLPLLPCWHRVLLHYIFLMILLHIKVSTLRVTIVQCFVIYNLIFVEDCYVFLYTQWKNQKATEISWTHLVDPSKNGNCLLCAFSVFNRDLGSPTLPVPFEWAEAWRWCLWGHKAVSYRPLIIWWVSSK